MKPAAGPRPGAAAGGRRALLLGAALGAAGSGGRRARGEEGPGPGPGAGRGAAPTEADRLKDNAYVQSLVKRSQEKREERDKERLDGYYKRNYQDYYEKFAGADEAAAASDLVEEWRRRDAEPKEKRSVFF